MALKEVSRHKFFGGEQLVYSHTSSQVKCDMKFGVYLPPNYSSSSPEQFPVLYYLSGLSCTEDNFITKSGMQRAAAAHGIVVVSPDTSPRGSNHPTEHDHWDFGSGAGFYLDATQEPWSTNYRMYSYVTEELIKLAEDNFNISSKRAAISGHSMGGHGALVIFLRRPDLFRCATALAPISNPSNGAWGIKAFSNYLGSDKTSWAEWDATELAKNFVSSSECNILVDQGEQDTFYEKELHTEKFVEAARDNPGINVDYRVRPGYNHFFPYIASFIDEHIEYVARFICAFSESDGLHGV